MNKKRTSAGAGATGETPVTADVYVVVNPITYGTPEVRHEAGAERSDIPAESIPWLREQGHIKRKGGN